MFVVSLDQEPIDRLRHTSDRIDGMTADLTDESAAEAAFSACLERFGRLDGVLAVAGGSGRRFGDGPVDQVPLSGWEATVRMNMSPMFLTVREAVRNMPEGGSIVVVTSVLGLQPQRMFVTHAYAAAKSAAVGFVKAVASATPPPGSGEHVGARPHHTPMADGLPATPTPSLCPQKQPLAAGMPPNPSPPPPASCSPTMPATSLARSRGQGASVVEA